MEHLPWQKQLARALRSSEDLVRHGVLSAEEAEGMGEVLRKYQLLLTPYYAGLIEPGNPRCPIRLQAVPQAEEMDDRGTGDPLADLTHQPAPRITHRYPNRVLLHLTPNCSMYCRYCFRKTLLNKDRDALFSGSVDDSLAYVSNHTEIREVILSGGDPLLLSDSRLAQVLGNLDQIPHLQRIRIHTRVPVTLPQRITRDLVRALIGPKKRVLVSHFNHPRELTPEAHHGLKQLTPFPLLNQSVLLKGINDCPDTLANLSEGLFTFGVLPYYLHHPDRAQGTAHFDLPPERGWQIYTELRRRLPGYLVPRYVVEKGGPDFKPLVIETLGGWDEGSGGTH